MKQLACYCVPLFDGAGLIGCGADEPEPAVLGGVAVRAGMLAVVDVERPLLAVLLLLFQPAHDQETDQQRHRNTGNPTPHAADALVTADHQVAQPQIG